MYQLRAAVRGSPFMTGRLKMLLPVFVFTGLHLLRMVPGQIQLYKSIDIMFTQECTAWLNTQLN